MAFAPYSLALAIFGAHMSIASGYFKSLEAAQRVLFAVPPFTTILLSGEHFEVFSLGSLFSCSYVFFG